MAGLLRRKGNVVFRSQSLATVCSKLHRSNCTLAQEVMDKCSTFPDINSVDKSKWKKVRVSDAGIEFSMIPRSSLNLMRLLRRQGHDAYFVGGCVRDLILHRVPKDYDIITTANLKQIRKLFHRSQVIGKRFPICHVWMQGSLFEVSSFDTVAQNDSKRENDLRNSEEDAEATQNSSLSKIYSAWDVKDLNRWKNSLRRDFTINSLFLDPLGLKVYDYANGMEDLKDLKLRTLIPAHLSFTEDCARILRGLRIAARLGLSLSKDIEAAIPKFVSSVAVLDQFRLLMEMDYMLAYGAAAPSILLLMEFRLLHVLLPFHAAYLDQASKTSLTSSLMLVRLFSNMDKLLSCDRPADSRLWIAVLAFQIALVRNPQEPIVVFAFASLLYHGNWSEAVKLAREHEKSLPEFSHVVSKSLEKLSDEDLAKAVSELAYQLKDTQYVLTNKEALQEALFLYPDFKCSAVIFIPKKKANEVAGVFERMSDVESYESEKVGLSIDYQSLKRGNPYEIKFVLGKIILDTMTEGSEQLNSVKKKRRDRNKIVPVTVEENSQEIVVCPDSVISGQATNEDQPVAQKMKRQRSKGPVSESPKPMSSKNHVKETWKMKSDDMPVKETQEANGSFVSDKSMSELVKILEKSRPQESTKEESDSLSSEKKKNQDQPVGQKRKKRRSNEVAFSDAPKPKISKRSKSEVPEPPKPKTWKMKSCDYKETPNVNGSSVSDKSMSGLFIKVVEKSRPQEATKKKSPSEKTNGLRKLSSLFK